MLHLLLATLLSFWGEFSLHPACCTCSFPCACCHTACEQDAAVWSPCGRDGGWNGSCMLNKRSLKAMRYLPLPWGWESMETALEGLWIPSEQLCGAQGKLFRSFRSGDGLRVYPRVSVTITLTPTHLPVLVSSQRIQFPAVIPWERGWKCWTSIPKPFPAL